VTITEKILAVHSSRKKVQPDEFIEASVDLALGNDITAPIAIKEFEKLGMGKVFNRNRIALVPDHFVPNKDVESAGQAKILRDFARRYKIKYYFEVGRMGIEHALLPEIGLIKPGNLVIGADSHTCTYGALGAFSTGVGSTDLAAVFATGKIWLKVPQTLKFIYYGKLKKWVGGKDLILHTIGDIGVDGALYCAMEFTGDAISQIGMSDRFAMCNMAIEAGAKNGIIEPDEITSGFANVTQTFRSAVCGGRVYSAGLCGGRVYSAGLCGGPPACLRQADGGTGIKADKNAKYKKVIEYDVSKIEPQVAFPSLPSNCKPISKVGNVRIDQAFIGSCTNGRIEDLRIAAKVLAGHKVHPDTRLIIIPATQQVYLSALKEGLVEIFVVAGGVVSTPSCGPCLGGHMGVLAAGERCIATTNRNFKGRMGDLKSEVYLANPAVVAASAIKGRISSPEEAL